MNTGPSKANINRPEEQSQKQKNDECGGIDIPKTTSYRPSLASSVPTRSKGLEFMRALGLGTKGNQKPPTDELCVGSPPKTKPKFKPV